MNAKADATKPKKTTDIQSQGVLVAFAVLLIIALGIPAFRTANNLANVATQVSMIGVVSIGMAFVILSGGICNHPDIYTALEESGAEVIWDDLCTGTRYFEGEIEQSSDPVEAIADRYLTRMVCPAKHLTVTARGESLVRMVKERNASGVIFMFLKFCDPHSFDYPYLKKFLDDAGVPNILLEVEEQLPSDAQLKTRFETFTDMID